MSGSNFVNYFWDTIPVPVAKSEYTKLDACFFLHLARKSGVTEAANKDQLKGKEEDER